MSIIMVSYTVFSLPPKSSVVFLLISGNYWFILLFFFFVSNGFAFSRMSYNWNQIVFFHLVICICSLLLSPNSLAHLFSALNNISFIVLMYQNPFIHSPIVGYLGFFKVLLIMIRAAINVNGRFVCQYVFISFQQRMNWQRMNFLDPHFFCFIRNYQTTVSQISWTGLHSHQQAMYENFCYSPCLPIFGVVSILDLSDSNRWVVVSQCCVSLHFPDDRMV